MVICWNAEGAHGKRKVGNPWFIVYVRTANISCDKVKLILLTP